jgi:hypothetical protein
MNLECNILKWGRLIWHFIHHLIISKMEYFEFHWFKVYFNWNWKKSWFKIFTSTFINCKYYSKIYYSFMRKRKLWIKSWIKLWANVKIEKEKFRVENWWSMNIFPFHWDWFRSLNHFILYLEWFINC